MSADSTFTPWHRGGSGLPLVLLHGFTDSWRTWELALPRLQTRHDVPALALRLAARGRARSVVALAPAGGWAAGDASYKATLRYFLTTNERVGCPVRIVWGTADAILPWPAAAVRYRESWLPHADWVELEGLGHCPQLDVPIETAELILGFTAG